MAEADLEAVIRQIAKAQNKALMAAAKQRHDRFMIRGCRRQEQRSQDAVQANRKKHRAVRRVDREAIAHLCGNAADSYARAMKKALQAPAKKPAKTKEA